jgi:predicted ATPase/class 3 adenylate cyclase/DNA-binding winged helix-turn-helix (wHTH) protein
LEEPVRFTIWGEVGVQALENPVVLSGRLRLLLAGLLMGRNAEVSRNDLISIVWGDESEPANAEASLRQYVSRLRKALGDAENGAGELITTTPTGYRLDVDRSWVDADVLADAVAARIRPDGLESIISGEPYGSYCDEWWCLAEVERQRQLAAEARDLPSASTTALPTGTVTLLFTGMERSTEQWESHREEMAEAVERHDEIVGSAVERNGGHIFSSAGDGFAAVFDRAESAVDAAVEAQRALQAQRWPSLVTVRVRMGLHTGEAFERGGDYFGPTVNRAARLMSVACGGQVLVSDVTRQLVSRQAGAGLDFDDLGEHRLEGIDWPERMWQLTASGLESDFPAFRVGDSPAGGGAGHVSSTTSRRPKRSLAVPATSFVGRDHELAEVATAIRGHRLVTLTGVGGVGKTRLALEAARQVEGDFPGGTWLVELAGVGDPASVSAAVASELDISPLPGVTLTDSIAQNLADRRCLLLLDNCEHVLDAAADLVEAVLATGDAPRMVITSREALRVEGEHVWSVPSLDISGGSDSPAVALFVDRARAVDHAFSISSEHDAWAVTEICRRLDGIALAIELAAARMLAMAPSEVRDRLDDRFRLLAGGRRGVERHQTLRHTLQWSYDLLSDNEAAVLQGCSVFAGGFDLPAAMEIAGLSQFDEYDMLDLLESLVRKSLLVVDRTGVKARYVMLETVRQFAEEQLGTADRGQQCRDRHAQYFARQTELSIDAYATPGARNAYYWFGTEVANLRAAFRWATSQDDIDTAATIAGKTAHIAVFSQSFEPISWCEELLDAGQAQRHPLLAYLYAGAALCCYAGRPEDSLRYAEAGWALRNEPGHERVLHGFDAVGLMVGYVFSGDPETWIAIARENIDNPYDTSKRFFAGLVWVLAAIGEHDEAVSLADTMLTAVESTGSPIALAFGLQAYGKAYAVVDPSTAIDYHRRAINVSEDLGNSLFGMVCRLELAGLEADHGDPLGALDSFEDIIDAFDEIGSPAHLGTAFGYLAVLLSRLDRRGPAATLIGAATRHPLATVSATGWTDVLEQTRSHLGEEHHAERLEAGHAMDLEQATTYAFEQIRTTRHQLATRES